MDKTQKPSCSCFIILSFDTVLLKQKSVQLLSENNNNLNFDRYQINHLSSYFRSLWALTSIILSSVCQQRNKSDFSAWSVFLKINLTLSCFYTIPHIPLCFFIGLFDHITKLYLPRWLNSFDQPHLAHSNAPHPETATVVTLISWELIQMSRLHGKVHRPAASSFCM